jgi:hypothetical protein
MKFHQSCVHNFKVNSRLERDAKKEWCAYPAPIKVIRLLLPAMQADMLEATSGEVIFKDLDPGLILWNTSHCPTVCHQFMTVLPNSARSIFEKEDKGPGFKTSMIIVDAVNEEAAIKRLIEITVHIKLIDLLS